MLDRPDTVQGAVKAKPPFKQKESPVLNACIQWLYFQGCDVTRCNSGSFTTRYTSKKTGITRHHRIQFGKRGMGDILACSPYGRWIEVECKGSDGEQKDHQKERQLEIERRNGVYVLAYSVDDLEARKGDILAKPVWGVQ